MQYKWLNITLATSLTALVNLTFANLTHAESPTSKKNQSAAHCNHKAGMMDMIDSNHDGNLSKAEYEAFHNQHFSAMDKNNDGNISKEEMQASHEEMHEKHGKMMGNMHPEMMPSSEQPTTPATNPKTIPDDKSDTE